MYMQGFKCTVTGATATHALAPAVPAAYCKDEPAKCVKGAKQMIVFNQAEGDNVPVPREARSPGYNAECGFFPGAQKDIFVGGGGGETPQPSASSVAPPASQAPSLLSIRAAASVAPSAIADPVGVELPSSKPALFASVPASLAHPVVLSASTLSTHVRPVASAASTLLSSVRTVASSTGALAAASGKACGPRRK